MQNESFLDLFGFADSKLDQQSNTHFDNQHVQVQPSNVITTQQVDLLQECMQALAGRCDGAITDDGIGFNGSHTKLGHTLAAMTDWDDQCIQYAYFLARFYQVQLASLGYSIQEIKAIPISDITGASAYVTEKATAKERKERERLAQQATLTSRKIACIHIEHDLTMCKFEIYFDKKDPDFSKLLEIMRSSESKMFAHDHWDLYARSCNISIVQTLISDYGFTYKQDRLDKLIAAINSTVVYKGYIKPSGKSELKVTFDYDKQHVATIKTLPAKCGYYSARWNPDTKSWTLPIDALNALVRAFPDFHLDTSLTALVKQTSSEIEDKEITENVDAQLQPIVDKIASEVLADGKQLRDYQVEGVKFLLRYQRGILAYDVGLGKTLTALIAARELADPVIVVCPASVRTNWQREANAIGMQVATYSWAKFPEMDTLPKVFTLILDESHKAKNTQTLQTKNAMALAAKASAVFMLTGTPLPNGRPIETYPLLKMANSQIAQNKKYYETRYCAAHQTRFGWDNKGAANLDEWSELVKDRLLHKTKEQCLKSLPELCRALIKVDGTDQENKEYKAIVANLWDDYQTRLAKGEISEADALVLMGIVRRASSKIKANYAIEKADEILESSKDDKVLIFTDFVETAKTLAQHYNCDAIIGDVDSKKRQEMVDRFTNNPNRRVLVATIKAAGEGLNIQAANHIIMVDRTFVPKDYVQAEGRCLVGNSLVYCPQIGYNNSMGIKKISDISIGDKVFTHTGQIQTVTDKAEREHRGLMTKIEYVGWFEPLTCTHDHKILVQRNGQIDWLPAHSILPGDNMVFPKQKNYKRLDKVTVKKEWRVYETTKRQTTCSEQNCDQPLLARGLCQNHYRRNLRKMGNDRPATPPQMNSRYKPLPEEIIINDDWLYLLGWYAAEGCAPICNNGKRKFISCSAHEKEEKILQKIGTILRELGINSSIRHPKDSKAIELRAYSRELANWFGAWFGDGAKNKSLPQEILALPPDQAAAFLRGYTDGDGYQRNKQVEWVSASYTLCYQVCLLAISAGFIPNMRKVVHPRTGVTHWVAGYTKFSASKYHKRVNNQDNNYIYKPVTKVTTYHDKIRVYDITVAEDHSFTTGFAIAHNCHRSGQKRTVFSWWLQYNDSDVEIDALIRQKQERIELALEGERKTMRGIATPGAMAKEVLAALFAERN